MKKKFIKQARLPKGAYDLNLDLARSLEPYRRRAEEIEKMNHPLNCLCSYCNKK